MLDLDRLVPLPEPEHTFYVGRGKYKPFSAAQMRALREQVARAVLEEAAKVCEAEASDPDTGKSFEGYADGWMDAAHSCEDAIRSLMPPPTA